jgi:hypothetical protein
MMALTTSSSIRVKAERLLLEGMAGTPQLDRRMPKGKTLLYVI